MNLIYLIVDLAVIGLVLYLVNQYVPMPSAFKQVMNVVVLIAVVLWLATSFLGGGGFRF